MRDSILKIINMKLKMMSLTVEHEFVDMELDQALNIFRNYCHRTTIPTGAYHLIADIAIFLLYNDMPSLFDSSGMEGIMSKVSGVKVGDSDLTIDGKPSVGIEATNAENRAILHFSTQMSVFRMFPSGVATRGY